MKKVSTIILCLFLVKIGFSQIEKADSIYNIWNEVGEIAFKDNYLYVKTENGIKIINCADVNNPSIVKSLAIKGNMNSALLKLHGNYLYSNFIDGIEIFDITDRESPVKLGEINKKNAGIEDFIVTDDYILCEEFKNDPVFGDKSWLVSHDVSDKSAPKFKYSEELGNNGAISDFVMNDYIFVEKTYGTYPQISSANHLYSIANPAFPTDIGEIEIRPTWLDFFGEDTIYTTEKAKIYGINLTNPLEADTFATYGYDGLATGLLNIKRDTIFAFDGQTGRIYTKVSEDSVAFTARFDLAEGELQFREFKNNRLFYPQSDSASIVNFSFMSEGEVDTIFNTLFYDISFDLNNFTTFDIAGDDASWDLTETNGITEAFIDVGRTTSNKDWLISSQINLPNDYQNFYLNFSHALRYENDFVKDYFKLYVSDNYDGSDPEAANWSEITFTWQGTYKSGFFDVSWLDLSAYKGKDIHIAFIFDYPDDLDFYYTTWKIKNIQIFGINAVNIAGSDYWGVTDGAATMLNESGWLSDEVNEDWLTTPELTLDQYDNYYFNFSHKINSHPNETIFGVYVSENYDGVNPANADWTKIKSIIWPENDNYEFLYSGTIDLSAYAGKTIHIAFKFVTTSTEHPRWYVKNLNLMGTNGDLPYSPKTFNMNPGAYNLPEITGVQLDGNLAFISHSGNNKKLHRISVVDISNRTSIIEKTKYSFSQFSYYFNFYPQDSLLTVYLDENTTRFYRFDENDNIIEKGSIINQDAKLKYIKDNHALVAVSGDNFRIFDISDEENPLPVFQFSNTYSENIAIDKENNYLYLAVPDGWNSIIEKWDISDISAPEKLNDYNLSAKVNNEIHFNNNVLYVMDKWGVSGTNPVNYGRLTAYKLSGTEFVEAGHYQVSSPKGISFNDDYAFMGVGSGNGETETGVHIISLQNPENLKRKYLLAGGGSLIDLAADNNVLTVAYPNKMDLYDLNSLPLPPSEFDLVSPQGTIASTDTILRWNASIDPNGNIPEYAVWIANNEAFSDADIDTTSETSYRVRNLLPEQTFYWKVFAIDESLENISSNQVFQCSLPSIELSALSVALNDDVATLNWNESGIPADMAVIYQILIANDADFTNADTITSSETSIIISDLLPGQYYYWKVRAGSSEYYSKWYSLNEYFNTSLPIPALVYAEDLGSNSESGVSMFDPNTLYTASAGSVNRYFGSGDLNYTLQVNGMIKSSTTVTPDHRVYIASTDNNLYAFNQNGVTVSGWPVALGAQLEASVAVDDNHHLYLGTSNGIYQCISASGEVLWSYNVGAAVKASSAITNTDTLFVINSYGRVLAFDLNTINAANPQPAWILETNHAISNSPAILGSSVIVSSDDGYLLKIKNNGSAGELALEIPTNGKSFSSPVIDANENVYFASDSGMVYSINSKKGTINWKSETYYTRTTPAPIYSTGALSEEGYFYIGDSKGVMYCFDVNSGEIVWSYRGEENSISGAVAYYNNKVFYTNADKFICLNLPSLNSGRLKSGSTLAWGTFQGNNLRTGNLDNIADAATGIEEIEMPNIDIYPNPVTENKISINLENVKSSEVAIQVLTVAGTILKELKVNNTGLLNIKFNYPTGIYLINIIDNGQTYSYPVIKKGQK